VRGLKRQASRPYLGAQRVGRIRQSVGTFMLRRVVVMSGLLALGLALSGCTKCGPFWDDWMQSPKACKSDRQQ